MVPSLGSPRPSNPPASRGGGEAWAKAANFVVALNRVNNVTVTTILVLHVGKTGRLTVGRTPLGLHVPSPLGFHDKRLHAQSLKVRFSKNTHKPDLFTI